VLAAAEPADGWTRQFRAAQEEKDEAKRRTALEKLAAADEVETLPVRALTRLAAQLEKVEAHASAARLLRRAQQQYPADFWVNLNLGNVLQKVMPPEYAESARFMTAAVSLRPESPGALFHLGHALGWKGQVDEAIACYKKAIELDPKLPATYLNLGAVLCDRKHDYDGAIASFRTALELEPKNGSAHYDLGIALRHKGQVDEAIGSFKKAIELDPKHAAAHTDLGTALRHKGLVDEAIACYQKAIEINPKYVLAHSNLGAILRDVKRDYDGAIASFRTALELDPKSAVVHNDLGVVWTAKGQLDEAIASYRKAIALDPKYAPAHGNLGASLYRKGQVDEAIASYRTAIELDPNSAAAHHNLGNALGGKGHVDEAIASYRTAIELKPKLTAAYTNLGGALRRKGELDEAIASFRKAVELAPTEALAHYNLGSALRAKGRVDEALACYQQAIALDPKCAEAHCNLGGILRDQGHFAESLAAFRRGHELGTNRPGWPYPSAEWVRQAENMVAMESKLPAFLKGEFQPRDAADRLALAGVCHGKKLHHAATRLYAAAFAADPKLADDLRAGHRYNAACHAALAAAGQGEDAASLDDKERMRLRQQTHDWLRADLALRRQQLESEKPADRTAVQQALRHWQQDTDLAGIRDAAALAILPADEQQACSQLWADVVALLKQAEASAQKETKP
jgi:tetratricopeptide (TPR) repeat protein